jgi:hypothetical protein
MSDTNEGKTCNRPDSKPDAFRDVVLPDGTVLQGKRVRGFRNGTLPDGTVLRGKRPEVKS